MKLTAVALLAVVLLAGCGSTGTGPYTGERNSTGQRHGQGTLTFADGSAYSGEWIDGKESGQGTMTHPDGRSWTGEFKVGLPVPYSGEFKNKDANKATLAPPATLAATTLPTATLAPPATLSELKLEPILIQPGDLPSGVSGAQVRDTAPAMFDTVPEAENTIYQQFEKNGDTIGGVTVFLYEDALMVENAYSAVISGMDTDAEAVSKLGDKAYISFTVDRYGGDLVFTRCSSMVHIRMTKNTPAEEIVSYAKRLDKRLSEAVCR